MVRFYGADISLLVKIITGIAFLFYTKSDVNGNLASTCVILYVPNIPPQLISFPTRLQATEDMISTGYGMLGFGS